RHAIRRFLVGDSIEGGDADNVRSSHHPQLRLRGVAAILDLCHASRPIVTLGGVRLEDDLSDRHRLAPESYRTGDGIAVWALGAATAQQDSRQERRPDGTKSVKGHGKLPTGKPSLRTAVCW